MTFAEAVLSLQLAAEERVGAPTRGQLAALRADEDRRAAAARDAVTR